ncbi:MAG TPA: DUF1572 family protein [Pyrinomonadaceae bacterium]|jgi:hypothetical protein
MKNPFATHYLQSVVAKFREQKKLAERAFAQLDDEQFFRALDPESNSVAVMLQHMSGNMLSRWTNFLNSDGEKPDRNRDAEFVVAEGTTRAAVVERWEQGWRCLFQAIESLQPDDLNRQVYIRWQALSVVEAINRQLAHYAYHTGQIVFLAKHLKGGKWRSLSIPRDQSEVYKTREFQTKD